MKIENIDVVPFLKVLGSRLRAARESRGINLSLASKLLRCSRSTLSCYENGVRSFTVDFLYRFLLIVNVKVSDVLPGDISELRTNSEHIENLRSVESSFFNDRNGDYSDSFINSIIKENLVLQNEVENLKKVLTEISKIVVKVI